MASQDTEAKLPMNVLESCASLSMRCQLCDGLSEGERFHFFNGLNKQRQYALIKGICEFHPRSQYSLCIWDKINGGDSGDKDLIVKLMFAIGRSRVDRSAFNLFVGCQTEWSFFEACTLPDPIPDFALPTMLSRAMSEQQKVSWGKVMWKFREALEDTTLSDSAMLRAMLACRVLITLEAKEGCKSALRLSDEGKRLCQSVLPYKFSSTRVWPASSILFFAIFDWMKRSKMVENALQSAKQLNMKTVREAGYRLMEVHLVKNDTIEMKLTRLDSSCRHWLSVESTFDPSTGKFHVDLPKCKFCPASSSPASVVSFLGGEQLHQIMLICKMFNTYVTFIKHGDTPREMIMAAVLYILRAGAAPRMTPLNMDKLNEYLEKGLKENKNRDPASIKPPVAALDYRTQEGKRVRRKKRNGIITNIQMPREVQTMETYVASLKTCETEHWRKSQPSFQVECDTVVKMLTKKKVQTFDIALETIPAAMRLATTSGRSKEGLNRRSPRKDTIKSTPRKRKLSDLGSDDEDDTWSPRAKLERNKCDLGSDDESITSETPDHRQVDVEPLPQPSRSNGNNKSGTSKSAGQTFVPLSSAVSARVEKVVLRETKDNLPSHAPMQLDENEQSDSEYEGDSESGSSSSSDEEEEEEEDGDDDNGEVEAVTVEVVEEKRNEDQEKGKASVARSSPLNTPERDLCMTVISQSPPLQTVSPTRLVARKKTPPFSVESTEKRQRLTPGPLDPQEGKGREASASQITTVVQSSPDRPRVLEQTTEPRAIPVDVAPSVTQLPLVSSVIENALLMSQSQPRPPTEVLRNSSVEDLFNGTDGFNRVEETNGDWTDAIDGIPHPLLMDPISSETLSRGQPIEGQGYLTLGPVSLETARRAVCVTKIMREVGGLSEIVPCVELAYTFNGEIAFRVGTNQKQLYSLDTFPGEWTSIQSWSMLLRAIVMSAALQSLDPTDLSRFWITSEKRLVCLPSSTGRVEMKIHPLELLQATPENARRYRQAVRTDSVAFAAWVRSVTAEQREKIEAIVRDADLTTRDESKTIDLDYFCRFFNSLDNALPWIEGK